MISRKALGRALGFGLLTAFVVAGCDNERVSVFEPVGPLARDFGIGASAANLPSGTVTIGGTSVTATASNLRAFSSGEYRVWVQSLDAQNLPTVTAGYGGVVEFFLKPALAADGSDSLTATGDTVFVTDSTMITAAGVKAGAFGGSDNPKVTSVRVIVDSTADGSDPTLGHAVFLTIESVGATTPGGAKFLWRRIGVGGGGAMTFGNYGGPDVVNTVSPADYVFVATGAGQGGARGSEISIDILEIARPPVGFYYAGYLVDVAGANGVLVDTLRSSWSPDSALSRVSLFNADTDDLLPNIVNMGIRAVQIRNCAATSAEPSCQNTLARPADATTFLGFPNFQLKLEPKGATGMSAGRSVTHLAVLPEAVTK